MSRRATGIFLPPPAIYLLFLALAWLLHWLWHLALPRNLWTHYFGWGLIDAGVLLMLWAGLLMLWRKTTVNPYGKPARLLEEGPFRFSRNPIYLADSLIYCGIALLWGSLWPWFRVCCRFVRGRAGACFCAKQGARSEVWSFQMSDEERSVAQKQARPFGLRGK
ncbi:methyltransferase family protein [Stutzerimonas nitrititolerans]|uniref:methyltransferase family protein n=1 Tax=Stutzerimonas nitrititolerans TaxID=2482751 RepID=UPI0028968ED2|nr:methyltransferase [Stutzerimonas nitrititolerans]